MSYQSVGTPRFYIDQLSWLKDIGVSGGFVTHPENSRDISSLFNLDPTRQFKDPATANTNFYYYYDPGHFIEADAYGEDGEMYGINFFAMLGHSGFARTSVQPEYQGMGIKFDHHGKSSYPIPSHFIPYEEKSVNFDAKLNDDGHVIGLTAEYDGFSMITSTTKLDMTRISQLLLYSDYIPNGYDRYIGCFCLGTYYDMPAPNLSLTMSREYGAIKEFTTYNGSSISNTMANKAPKWGKLGAWELNNYNNPSVASPQALSRSGRKTWQLKFSYMDDGDLWGANQSLGIKQTAGTIEEGAYNYYIPFNETGVDTDDLQLNTDDNAIGYKDNILTNDSYFSQVWHKTLGGTLPFIFQPNNTNFNTDQFAICRFKESSLKATQTAFNIYDISVTIEEVW